MCCCTWPGMKRRSRPIRFPRCWIPILLLCARPWAACAAPDMFIPSMGAVAVGHASGQRPVADGKRHQRRKRSFRPGQHPSQCWWGVGCRLCSWYYTDRARLHTGRQFVDAANTQRLPAWTRIDMGGRYTLPLGTNAANLRLGIENLFNAAYWASAARGVTLGGPRTVKLSLSMAL